jgi:hypothetical protein
LFAADCSVCAGGNGAGGVGGGSGGGERKAGCGDDREAGEETESAE